ncbi:MAG: CoA activase [Deltaproteobacteria bacterium]|nr:CoA activase [Deltaproteobacteria bacterium]
MIVAGIDSGAKTTKTVIMQDGKIIGKGKVLTGFDQKMAVEESVDAACRSAGISRDKIQKWGGTGSGKNAITNAAFVNEVKAMAKGGAYLFPNARTIADVGAEEGRAVKTDGKGGVVDFAINEKCAAGAGAFVEAMARALEVTIEEMGSLCMQSEKTIPMNAQCAIFAESEVVGLIHARTSKPDISRAIHDAIASRVVSMIRRIGVNEDVVLMGGVGCNPGFKDAMLRELGVKDVYVPDEPEYGMAIGAAAVVAEED